MSLRAFRPEPEAAAEARRFARSLPDSYGMDTATEELLISELATNVIRHASTPFFVDVTVDGDRAQLGVSDGVALELAPREAPDDETSGRELVLLDAHSTRSGVERTDSGKRVWFEVPLERGSQ